MQSQIDYQNLRGTQPLSNGDLKAIEKLKSFSDIVFTPIDIEIEFNEKKFIEYFDTHKEDIVTFNTKNLWKGIKPISGPHVLSPHFKIDSNFVDAFPHLLEEIISKLPLRQIHMLHFWEQNVNIADHQDGGAADVDYFFPCSYRIFMIRPSGPSFYVKPFLNENNFPYGPNKKNIPDSVLSDKSYIQLPSDKNVFCFNNSACKHGADLQSGKKIISFVDAEIDFERHLNLLTKSMNKFSDLIIEKPKLYAK